MIDGTDPALEAAATLRAAGIAVEPDGEEPERWRIGDFAYGDADLMRLAERFGAAPAGEP